MCGLNKLSAWMAIVGTIFLIFKRPRFLCTECRGRLALHAWKVRATKLSVDTPPERVSTVVLMLRVWVMYGKSKRIGLFLSAVFALALGAALIVPLKKPAVRQIT